MISYADGFKVRNGCILLRAGSRRDLAVVAAGCYLGLRVIMVVREEDAALIRDSQTRNAPASPDLGATMELNLPRTAQQDPLVDALLIFCSDNFPDHIGTIYEREMGE
jgi:hypothetical protein